MYKRQDTDDPESLEDHNYLTEDTDSEELASLDSWEDENEEQDNEYQVLLQTLTEKWLLVELNHTVTKAATNAFWRLATSLLPSLFDAKKRLDVTRKIPQFVHIRRQLHKRFLPDIDHSTAYRQEGSEEIVELRDHEKLDEIQTNPFLKIYETASVSVITKTVLRVLQIISFIQIIQKFYDA